MPLTLGPRATRLLTAWRDVASQRPRGQGYDLTPPTRSARYRALLDEFIETPSESTFEALWVEDILTAATEWHPPTIQNLWSGTLEDMATFFDEIRSAESYDHTWEDRVSWNSVLFELYTRSHLDRPIVSDQARRGLEKFGFPRAKGFEARRDQMDAFQDEYLDIAGHVTESRSESIPVSEEIDQLLTFIATTTDDDIAAEIAGPRGDLYAALRGYPSSSSRDSGPIEINFETASPFIDRHITARRSDVYADVETRDWAGYHYESWKWDFARYVTEEVATAYDLSDLQATELEGFFDAFWANADAYTDMKKLSTPVPQFLLGRWGVSELSGFREYCLEHPDEAAAVLSLLFSEDEHLVDRLHRFHDFTASSDVPGGTLLRIATTFLMGAYPDEYVNFQYERFNTFFSEFSDLDSLKKGYDARQYYRIVLACRDIRDVMRTELPDASMLDVHTLIRLYQDSLTDDGDR